MDPHPAEGSCYFSYYINSQIKERNGKSATKSHCSFGQLKFYPRELKPFTTAERSNPSSPN